MAYEIENDAPAKRPDRTRPDDGPMTKEEKQTIVTSVIQECVDFTERELSPGREQALRYYHGQPFGNEVEGRSKMVLTETRDAIRSIIPQMMRVFMGSDEACEYVPAGPDDVEAAQQAMDYARYVFEKENDGFMLLHAAIKDGLLQKNGALKWGWEDTAEVKEETLENVSPEELQVLAEDDTVDLVSAEETGVAEDKVTPLYTVELTRKGDGRLRIYALPPEELLYSPEGRSVNDALFIGHQTRKTRGELLALGVSKELLDEYGDDAVTLRDAPENIARREGALGAVTNTDPDAGDANEKILYVEGFMRVDFNGDGINELRRVCTVGPQYKIATDEAADAVNIAVWSPDPEPHTLSGLSVADDTMDIQLGRSMVARAGLDSLALSIFPRTEVVEGQVNIADAMNEEIGALVRVRAPGMMREVKHTFDGAGVLGMLGFFDDVKENRVGISKGAAGIDADALQSSTQAAVGAAVTSAQLRTELLCRFFGEMLVKPLFRGILRELVAHQPRKRMVKLRGKWVEVDPRKWNADMDVSVNVGLGIGFKEHKIEVLKTIAEKQENILSAMGLSQPLVTPAQYSRTLRQMLALEGYPNGTQYFNEVPDDWQPPQQPPAPDPNMALVQVEAQKAQHAAMMKEKEFQLKMQTMQLEQTLKEYEQMHASRIEEKKLEIERERLAQDYALRLEEMRLKYGTAMAQHEVEQHLEDARAKEQHGAELAQRDREMDMEHERGLYQIDKDAEVSQAESEETE